MKEHIDKIVFLCPRHDPDILVGWQIETLSWGYLIQRAAHISLDLYGPLSRVLDNDRKQAAPQNKSDDSEDNMDNIRIPGRIVLDLWRVIKSEVRVMILIVLLYVNFTYL